MTRKLAPVVADQLLTIALVTPEAKVAEDAFYEALQALGRERCDELSNLYAELVTAMLENTWAHGFECGRDPRLLVYVGGAQ